MVENCEQCAACFFFFFYTVFLFDHTFAMSILTVRGVRLGRQLCDTYVTKVIEPSQVLLPCSISSHACIHGSVIS